MTATPTLSDLALFAHKRLGETAHNPVESRQSCLDVVVKTYAQSSRGRRGETHAATYRALENHLNKDVDSGNLPKKDVDQFVDSALSFLEAQYPRHVEARRDQDILGTLYWAHLIEARYVSN